MATDVKALRKRLGWSQERLARQLGVSFSTISRWERGHGEPSPMAEKLLQELQETAGADHWPSADQIDISPIVGMFKGPPDLSIRHHHYLDPDAH
ncbi:MAG: helix-turn-helix domain-containing protein [bacterium]